MNNLTRRNWPLICDNDLNFAFRMSTQFHSEVGRFASSSRYYVRTWVQTGDASSIQLLRALEQLRPDTAQAVVDTCVKLNIELEALNKQKIEL